MAGTKTARPPHAGIGRTLAAATMLLLAGIVALGAQPVAAQGSDRRWIRITEGVIEPLPLALPMFVAETEATAAVARDITRLVVADLVGTGLFREIPQSAHIGRIISFDAPLQYADWRAINAQALVTGSVSRQGLGRVNVRFRLFDVVTGQQVGEGLQFTGDENEWRRIAHKVADAVYSRITGESGYFDSRVAFVAESGPKDRRVKRLALMDYDGANVEYLTDGRALVLAPRFSPDGRQLLFTTYESGVPRIGIMEIATRRVRALAEQPGSMSFAPRFAPDGRKVVFSLTQAGNTDIYALDTGGRGLVRLTSTPAIETAPSFSPDGGQIVFESDRSGTQQIYVMPASGGDAQRISAGRGRYGTPVWSPRGDLIAFTKQLDGRFHIGVMRVDGSEERLLTASFLDEGPTWSPNGRVLMFTRETPGAQGQAGLYSVEISGRTPPRPVALPVGASDPAWSPLLP
jgi:TolB protein